MVASAQVAVEKPRIKKTDWFYYHVFFIYLMPAWLTPNHISYLRVFLCYPLFKLMVTGHLVAAGFLFIFMALLDGLDGAMARIRNQVTSFGKIVDPAADKVQVITVLATFDSSITAWSYIWLSSPIIGIDVILFFIGSGKAVVHDVLPKISARWWFGHWFDPQYLLQRVRVDETGANNWGKAKMVVMVVTCSAMLLFDPNANYFISPKLALGWNMTMYDIFVPLLFACIFLGAKSLLGHCKVIHFTK
jgi:phosphatidylglycerophosphate synthase